MQLNQSKQLTPNPKPMKVSLLVGFLLISGTAFSQLTKGALLLEGSGSLGFSKSDDEYGTSQTSENKSFQFSLRPSLGIMLSEKWMLGAGIGYNYRSSFSENDINSIAQTSDRITNTFLLTTFLRRYAHLTDKLYFTATLNASGGLGKSKDVTDYEGIDPETSKYDTYEAGVSVVPGLTYFVTNKWAITGSIGQVYVNFDWRESQNEDEKSKHFATNGGLNFSLNTFSIGVQYFLRNGTE